MNETEFEKYNAGELILIGTQTQKQYTDSHVVYTLNSGRTPTPMKYIDIEAVYRHLGSKKTLKQYNDTQSA